MRHIKIVCTIGPGSNSPEIIENMLLKGMNIARLNLAYGSQEEHANVVTTIRKLSNKRQIPAAMLLDLPGTKRSKDDIKTAFRTHFQFASSVEADFIALSFISSIRELKQVCELAEEMDINIPLVIKIERAQALEESTAMLEMCQGMMVARGDLALDISIEKVPIAQKRLIKEANRLGKPVITATQMLESMVRSPSPTRAEATDVANAVFDGTDAVMLSEETAMGRYPVEATEIMSKIIMEAEPELPYDEMLREKWREILPETDDATARAACYMADQVNASAIVAFTTGGTTALRVSKYRPRQPIIGVTPFEPVVRRMLISWGVQPIQRAVPNGLEDVFEIARQVVLEKRIAEKGDNIVVTAGLPLTVAGSTNLVKVHQV